MEQEIWKDIRELEGRYQASNLGNIKSLIRNKLMSFYIDKFGYARVCICIKGNNKSYSTNILVHQLIADTFLETAPDGYEVNHINSIKLDNRIVNLEYVTRSENIKHAIKIGLHRGIPPPPMYGEDHPFSNLSNIEREKLLEQWVSGSYTQFELSLEYNIPVRCIKAIISRLKEGHFQGIPLEKAKILQKKLLTWKSMKVIELQDYVFEQSKFRTFLDISRELNMDVSYVYKLSKRAAKRYDLEDIK